MGPLDFEIYKVVECYKGASSFWTPKEIRRNHTLNLTLLAFCLIPITPNVSPIAMYISRNCSGAIHQAS
jgi:hypothetical protein